MELPKSCDKHSKYNPMCCDCSSVNGYCNGKQDRTGKLNYNSNELSSSECADQLDQYAEGCRDMGLEERAVGFNRAAEFIREFCKF